MARGHATQGVLAKTYSTLLLCTLCVLCPLCFEIEPLCPWLGPRSFDVPQQLLRLCGLRSIRCQREVFLEIRLGVRGLLRLQRGVRALEVRVRRIRERSD